MTKTKFVSTLDFDKVDQVRKRLELSIKDMAALFGVSRLTYYNWTRGGSIRESNEKHVKDVLRRVLPLLKSGEWPPEESYRWKSPQRLEALLEILSPEA